MKNLYFLFLSISATFLFSCGPKISPIATQADTVIIKEITLDTVLVQDKPEDKIPQELPLYRAEPQRSYNIKHTILDLAFDWNKEHVLGKAFLDVTAYFYPTDEVVLDAVNFDIHAVKYDDADGEDIPFTYNGTHLSLNLEEELTRHKPTRLYIDYTAKPSEGDEGGSAAIMSDKGLFFINARGENPHKPRQIWTQGETQSNSKWFPTFDKPNERTTQEMYITTENNFQVLTNGLKTSTQDNGDGTRTEHWEMKTGEGHAPYLFMLTIGEFAVIEDSWNGIPIQYYVEEAYKDDAAIIFAHTPEMLTFFSDILDYPYPWDKYSQVVVRDYVSGAMENTTASLFGEFVQKHSNELITEPNDGIVAHEMIHQWFGDLVTCESWSNIVLNEGFANYSEYLWSEYKYGLDAAQVLQANSRTGYFNTAAQAPRPLVHYEYGHREEVFDAHSYNKGGLVLHMLRDYLGEELFYRSLNYYLHRNAFSSVEVADLRLAIEKVSGEDMNWFFDQWFHTAGHPILRIKDNYDKETQVLTIDIKQEQHPEKSTAIFKLPTKVALYYSDDDIEFHDIVIDKRSQSFSLEVKQEPILAIVDPTSSILAVKRHDRNTDELASIARVGLNTQERIDAFKDLQYADTETFRSVRSTFLEDDSWYIRRAALQKLDYSDKYKETLKDIATSDDRPEIRILALHKLKKSGDSTLLYLYEAKIDTAFAMAEQLQAIEALYEIYPEKALAIAEKYGHNTDSDMIAGTLSTLYASAQDSKYLPFFKHQVEKASGYGIMNVMTQYADLVSKADREVILENINFLSDQYEKQKGSFLTQIFLAKGIFDIRNSANYALHLDKSDKEEITAVANTNLKALMENTQDERLKEILQRFL